MAITIANGLGTTDAKTLDGQAGVRGLAAVNIATQDQAGFAALTCESDDGAVTGTLTRIAPEASTDYRLRVGTDTCLWQDVFHYNTVNAGIYAVTTSSATATQAAGFLNINAGNSTTATHHANVRTHRTFSTLISSPLYLTFTGIVLNQSATDSLAEVGFFLTTGAAAQTDGVGFRWTASGDLVGVLVNNSVSVETLPIPKPTAGERAHYIVSINDDTANFWINQQLVGRITAPAAAGGHSVMYSGALPIVARVWNTGTASGPKQLRISEWSVSQGDVTTNRSWPTQMVGAGLSSITSPPGTTSTQTANMPNSAAPANATLSNTVAGYTTMGGLYQFAAVAGAETDYALFAYQVPAASLGQPGKNLMVCGIRISAINVGSAVATTATVLMWSIGVGSTAASLSTTDSLTGGTRGPRKIFGGTQSFPVGSAVGTAAVDVDIDLDVPLLVEAGSFLHVILRMPIATATPSQVIRGGVRINGYFE